MSSVSGLERAYAAFLGGSDLAVWTNCLDEYLEFFGATADLDEARPIDLLRALTIAHYVAWLARRAGDDLKADQAVRQSDALGARLGRAPLPDGRETTLIRAVIVAGKGYPATARRMTQALAEAPPVDVALLMMPARAAARAARLKPFVLGCAEPVFIPAVYIYGASLLDLGYQSDTAAIVERHGGVRGGPLMVDLCGQLFELAGAWKEARDAYDRSTWPLHHYRRTLCDVILGEPVDRLAGWPQEAVRKFTAGMQDFSGETDRAGVVRSASVVRACRWSGFDNWLVHFELGRLGFQRRRHAEAERHLAAAAQAAPLPYRFPILFLRFTNLTWLGDELDLLSTPEALEAANAALQVPATEQDRAPVRTWVAHARNESGVLDPVFACGTAYEIGQAHFLRGSTPDAVANWCSCIGAGYRPRAFFQLLAVFASWGFENTASRLAEIVEWESEDSFFDLWELANHLATAVKGEPSTLAGDGPLSQRLARVEARLEELVGSDFQDAIRAFYYFSRQRRLEPAQRMLRRAEQLAEGAEENLRLAIARRKAAVGEWDPRSLEALRRAELQSDDRLERLLIARELAQLGQLPHAHAILTEEGAFSTSLDFAPIEYVLALEVAKSCALAEGERQILERAAETTLQRDVDAGRFLHYGSLFVDRLGTTLGRALKIPIALGEGISDGDASPWRKWVSELERLQREQRAEQELRLLNEKVEALRASPSLFSRLALWGLHRDRLHIMTRTIDQFRPTVADDQVPMARDDALKRRRAQALAGIWQPYLLAMQSSEAERRLAEIRQFFEEERQLTERWDRMRRSRASELAIYARQYAKQGAVFLGEIRAEVKGADPWPAFLGLGSAIVTDARQLAERLGGRIDAALEGIGP